MNYKITAFDRLIGQIEVLYSHEGQAVAKFNIDVPIENKRFVIGERLEKEIQDRAPTWLVQRYAEISKASNFSDIENLVTVSSSEQQSTHVTIGNT